MRRLGPVVVLIVLALCGCGGGASTFTPQTYTERPQSTATSTTPSSNGLAVTMQFQSAGTSVATRSTAITTGLPANTASLVIWVLDPATGQNLVPPIHTQRSGQNAQTVLIQNVPAETVRVIISLLDAAGAVVGSVNQTVEVASGGITTLDASTSVTLTNVLISPPNPSIAYNAGQQFTATAAFSDSSSANVNGVVMWNSATTGVATMSSSGFATAVKPGQSAIGATFDGTTGSTVLTVKAVPVVSIAVGAPSPSFAKGTSEQLTATGTLADRTTQDLTGQVTWSTNPVSGGAVTVSTGGLATANFVGNTTAIATLGTISGQTTLTVTSAQLVSIVVTPANKTVPRGLTQQMTATGQFTDTSTQDLTKQVTWSTSPTGYATVDSNGLLTATNPGNNIGVVATYNGTTPPTVGNTTVTVGAPVITSLTITPPTAMLRWNSTLQYHANGTYSDGSTGDVTSKVQWSSSTPSLAQIGNATGLAVVSNSSAILATTIQAVDPVAGARQTATLNEGEFMFVNNGGAQPSLMTSAAINSNGTTTLAGQCQLNAGIGNVQAVASNPYGTAIYQGGAQTVCTVAVDPTAGPGQGNITSVGSSSVAPTVSDLAVLPDDSAVLLVDNTHNTVSLWGIDPTSGNVTTQIGNTFAVSTTAGSPVVDPLGRYAIVSDDAGFETFSLGVSNSQPVITAVTTTTTLNPGKLALAPGGAVLYSFNGGGLTTYSVSTSGIPQLTPLLGAVNWSPNLSSPLYLALSPDAMLLSVATQDNLGQAYAYQTTSLVPTTQLMHAVNLAPSAFISGLVQDSLGQYIHVVTCNIVNQAARILTVQSGSGNVTAVTPLPISYGGGATTVNP